jgi:hypothetical protein
VTRQAGATDQRRRPPHRSTACLITGAVLIGVAVVFVAITGPGSFVVELTRAVARVVLWAAVLWSCATLFGRASGSSLRGLAHLTWDGAAGLAVFIGLLVGVGQVPGVFRPGPLIGLVVILLIVALGIARFTRRASPAALSSAPGVTWVVLACVAAVGLVWNRVPPVFFDSLAYHFAQPNLWLIEGRIAPEAWSLHSWFPPGMSALYGLGLAAGGNAAANDANLLLGLLLLGMTYDVARRLWTVPAGLLALGWLLGLPLLIHALAIPAADLAHGTFGFGALACWVVVLGRGGERAEWLRRAAYLCAGALLTKYLGVLIPLGLIVVLLLLRVGAARSGPYKIALREAFVFALPGLILVLPWLGANAVAVGNPVAPVLSSVLPVDGLAAGGAPLFRRDARGGLPRGHELLHLYPRLIAGDDEESRIYPTPAWGWVPVVLLPAVILGLPRDRTLRWLLALFVVLLLVWLLTFRWERFLVAATALLAVALAGATLVAWRRGGPLRLLPALAGVLAGISFARAILAVLAFTGGGSVAVGHLTPGEFIEGSLPVVGLYREAATTLDPARHRVLVVGEMRHHFLDLPHSAPTGFNTHPLVEALREPTDAVRASRALCAAGYTHLIVDLGWARRSAAGYPSLALFRDRPELLTGYLETLGPPLARRDGQALWRIPQ